MSNSSLVTINVPAKHYSEGRDGRKIEMITIHHMASVLSAEQCGKIFQGDRKASSHYGIGNNGEIGLYVDESNTAWANGNWDANCKAVTIETSNDKTGGDWTVGEKALNSLIKLVADIAKRNNLGTLVKGKNITWHKMYAATACPGEYLLRKMDYIVSEANKLNESKPEKKEDAYTVKITANVLNVRQGPGTNYKITTTVKKNEVYTIVETSGNWGKLKSGAGWICLDYTSKTTTTTTPSYKTMTVTAKSGLNVRKGPGTSYGIVTTYKYGTKVKIYSITNGWAKGDKGYMSATYLK